MQYVIPLLFIAIIAYAAFKKVNVYSSFSRGLGEAVNFTFKLVPVLCAIFIMCEVFERSRLSDWLTGFMSPVFGALGVPRELCKLVLIKPFSGSGSLAYLTQIIEQNGADAYVSRCACVLYGSSETCFYISAVYFASSKNKKRVLPIVIILFSTFLTTVIACLLCKVL